MLFTIYNIISNRIFFLYKIITIVANFHSTFKSSLSVRIGVLKTGWGGFELLLVMYVC